MNHKNIVRLTNIDGIAYIMLLIYWVFISIVVEVFELFSSAIVSRMLRVRVFTHFCLLNYFLWHDTQVSYHGK